MNESLGSFTSILVAFCLSLLLSIDGSTALSQGTEATGEQGEAALSSKRCEELRGEMATKRKDGEASLEEPKLADIANLWACLRKPFDVDDDEPHILLQAPGILRREDGCLVRQDGSILECLG